LIGRDIRPVMPVVLGLGRPRQHRRTRSQKNPAPHSLCLQLKPLEICANAAPDQALFEAFSSQVKSLGGSENATKQKFRAVSVNACEQKQL
jgi:hypothetical protein